MKQLHLGVVDVAYSDKDGTTTTGDVAGYLEDEYHIMRVFYEMNEEFINQTLADTYAGMIETMNQGNQLGSINGEVISRIGKRKLAGAGINGKIEERFRDFLDSGELNQMLPAEQQSAAAAAGVNHRKKRPYVKKNKPRQAFIDTGLYQASFRAWID